MKLNSFISGKSDRKPRKYKTINLDNELHLFLKRTANHYDIPMSDLMYNIINQWKKKFQGEIENDILNQFKKQ